MKIAKENLLIYYEYDNIITWERLLINRNDSAST